MLIVKRMHKNERNREREERENDNEHVNKWPYVRIYILFGFVASRLELGCLKENISTDHNKFDYARNK